MPDRQPLIRTEMALFVYTRRIFVELLRTVIIAMPLLLHTIDVFMAKSFCWRYYGFLLLQYSISIHEASVLPFHESYFSPAFFFYSSVFFVFPIVRAVRILYDKDGAHSVSEPIFGGTMFLQREWLWFANCRWKMGT